VLAKKDIRVVRPDYEVDLSAETEEGREGGGEEEDEDAKKGGDEQDDDEE
jgi:hypothetical protein